LREDRILMGDPSLGVHAIPRSRFESMWTNRVLFVIHNRQEQAAFNRYEDWRLAPSSPMAEVLVRDGLERMTLSRHGPGEF
jgi:predicted double-glycine peptidase